ncbi:MAG: Mur ligase family protein [Erysipelotrichales bacterium]|nr:Mur ligase family protein [Erysipelotrichales bacterium]
MKLSKLKEKLMNQLPENMKPIGLSNKENPNGQSENEILENNILINPNSKSLGALNDNGDQTLYNNPLSKTSVSLLDEVKIIGIVGSRGKTTTAKIIHEYLLSTGRKSMLFSSAEVFSPAGTSKPGEGSETPLLNEGVLLRILVEAEAYQPNFIVLEVNESSISKGLAKDIPFAAKVLTNIFRDHHIDQEPTSRYVENIKSFFKATDVFSDKESFNESALAVNVFGLTGDITREEFNELLNLNSSVSYTFGSVYTAEMKNANYNNLDTVMHYLNHDINGMEINLRSNGEFHRFNTKMIIPHNAFNILCAITTLNALKVFEANLFSKVIADLKTEGRDELFCFNDRKVIVGMFLAPTLEVLSDYKSKGQINKIRVVVGAPGTGYKGWDSEFMTDFFISQRSKVRKQAMDYTKQYADFVYLTENDSGADDTNQICNELQSYLKESMAVSEIILDRKEAIRSAIEDSEPGDIVFIAGRGNRSVLVVGEDDAKILKDSSFVKEMLVDAKN